MKIANWLKIISGEKKESSAKEIQAEIDFLRNEIELNSNALDELNKTLVEAKKQALGGNGSHKDIKTLEDEIHAIKVKIESMGLVVDDLQGILTKTQEKEKTDRLSQINKQIEDLGPEEEILWDSFIEHYSKAAAAFYMIKGRPHNALLGDFTQPFLFGTDRHKVLRNEIEKHIAGTTSIADTKRELRFEIEKINDKVTA
ncbi:MAG: hypothetical protein KKF12_12255 [Proteobacteria bacterium]|nr:hypothetical protein [Desulfobacula sp.]MBU3951017.1 hypothetical protein [Pseudomonadota bacterium]MBU4131585.1 hypothetical protein [Pseudomonadota bacterium]